MRGEERQAEGSPTREEVLCWSKSVNNG